MSRLLSRTVDGVLRASARRVPDRTALRYADRSWTYTELDAAVSTAAAVLREAHHGIGLPEYARVATYGHNSDAYLIAFL
ncbi:AMP-binding protein, partial [Streptomyces sp. NPDC056295]